MNIKRAVVAAITTSSLVMAGLVGLVATPASAANTWSITCDMTMSNQWWKNKMTYTYTSNTNRITSYKVVITYGDGDQLTYTSNSNPLVRRAHQDITSSDSYAYIGNSIIWCGHDKYDGGIS